MLNWAWWIGRLGRDFVNERGGNVVLTFALALIPLVGGVGAAVDYSRGNSAKAAMQAAVDATALMLSKEASSLSNSQLNTRASAIFAALFNRTEVNDVQIVPTYSEGGGAQLVVTGSGTVATTFSKVLGFSKLQVNVSSTVRWGNLRMRVALVLDNTGSMNDDGKMKALQKATKNLLDQLQSAVTTNEDVYVSIIPFAKDVAVDPIVNYTQTWIDWTDWDDNNGNCVSGGSTERSKSKCKSKGGKWTAGDHSTWNGCLTDRGDSTGPSSSNYDTNVAPPVSGVTASQFPAEQYDACPAPMMGLTYDWSGMKKLINKMTPNGYTNQAIGLAWGWLSLVGGGPFTVPPMDKSYDYQQTIILLTDGLNTANRWYEDQNPIDAREKMTCDSIKAAGITLYTIQVNTGGDPTSALLRDCASDSKKFFLLTSANAIVTTFEAIASQLSQLRVAK